MGHGLDRLFQLSSSAIEPPARSSGFLDDILGVVNGFYCFESALHVRASSQLAAWNSKMGWRAAYQNVPVQVVFFAEDLFGNQFGSAGEEVVRLDVETGSVEIFADSLDGWAERILADYNLQTGFSLGHEWQQNFGALKAMTRLIPRTPFVLGGEFVVSNLEAQNDSVAMRRYGSLSSSIAGLKDGVAISFDPKSYSVSVL